MREGLALTAIGSAALLTLAVASATTLRHANDLSHKERQALDNSIHRIVVEQVARRDDVLPSAAAADRTTPQTSGAAARDITELAPGPEARKEAAKRRDPEERAEREARAARAMATRPAKKRHPPPAAAFRPDRVLPNAFMTIRKLTFGVF
jgi:hypothetical protein